MVTFFFLQQIQRIPRYSLLLEVFFPCLFLFFTQFFFLNIVFIQNLHKHTDENHSEFNYLFSTVSSIKRVVVAVNDQMKQVEILQKLEELQSSIGGLPHSLVKRGRYFIKKSNLIRLNSKSFDFPNFLLLLKKS